MPKVRKFADFRKDMMATLGAFPKNTREAVVSDLYAVAKKRHGIEKLRVTAARKADKIRRELKHVAKIGVYLRRAAEHMAKIPTGRQPEEKHIPDHSLSKRRLVPR